MKPIILQQISFSFSLILWVKVEGFPVTSKIKFIGDFFSRHNVHVISTFTCSTEDTLWLTKSLATRQFWTVPTKPELTSTIATLSSDVFSDNYFQLGVFLDYDCEISKLVFAESSSRKLLSSSYKWLIWSNCHVLDGTPAEFNIDSDVTWATPDKNTDRVILHDLYKSSRLVVTKSGYWDQILGLVNHSKDQKYTSRRNLEGVSLHAGIVINVIPVDNIEARLSSPVNRYADSMARYHYALYSHLRDWFNFKLQLQVTNSYGYLTQNGSFDGLVGLLQRGEVQLGISAVRILPARLDAVDFSAPTWLFRCPLMFRHPDRAAMPDALLQPFTMTVWLCSGASWLIVMITLRLIVVFESRLLRHPSSAEGETDQSWGTAFITTMGIIVEQGSEINHKWTAWRVLFLFALVQTVILNNYYGASLVSSLVAPSKKSIRTVQDIIDSNLKVGYVNVSYNRDFFQKNSDPVLKKLYSKKIFPSSQSFPNEFPRDIAVKKMRDERFAIQAEAISLYPLIEDTFITNEKCSLSEIVAFPSSMLYSIIQKGSPFRKLITFGFRALWERGLMQRQLKQWRPSAPDCYGTSEVQGIELEAISLALILLAAGIITAFTILLMECSFLNNKLGYFIHFSTRHRNGKKLLKLSVTK